MTDNKTTPVPGEPEEWVNHEEEVEVPGLRHEGEDGNIYSGFMAESQDDAEVAVIAHRHAVDWYRARLAERDARIKELESTNRRMEEALVCIARMSGDEETTETPQFRTALAGASQAACNTLDPAQRDVWKAWESRAVSQARADEREALTESLDEDHIHEAVKKLIDQRVKEESILFQDVCETHGREFAGPNDGGEECCQECAADGFWGSLGSYDSEQLAVDVTDEIKKAIRARGNGGAA